jgi:HlyD family secretion protein
MAIGPIPPPPALLHRSIVAMRTLPARLWSHKFLVLAATLVVGVGIWQSARLIMGPDVAVDQAKRSDLIESVVATGNVESPFRVIIGSQITGTVESVDVDEGQRVTEGQKLVSLESRELTADVVQAAGAVAQADAHMRQLSELTLPTARDSLKDMQATLLNARQEFDRTSALARQGFATRAALDSAQKDLDVARTQLRSAELQVYTASPGGSDYVTGQTELNQSNANLDTARSRLGYATIAAPRAGVLITRNVERGTVVQPGNTLLVLAPDGETQLLLEIDERDLGKLALAQTAVASADAYPDQRFAAVVAYINPGVDITRASIEVKLNVSSPPDYLRQDMTVSVDIQVARSANAIVLPGRSVRDGLSAAPWVMTIKNGRATRQPVRVGIQGTTQSEILEGIAVGDFTIPATSDVAAGQRVRPISP